MSPVMNFPLSSDGSRRLPEAVLPVTSIGSSQLLLCEKGLRLYENADS